MRFKVFFSNIMLVSGHYNLLPRVKALQELFNTRKDITDLVDVDSFIQEQVEIEQAIIKTHSYEYIKHLQNFQGLDGKYVWEGTLVNTIASIVAAEDLIKSDVDSIQARLNFVLHSDGGHHAGISQAWGMCYLNHLAVTANYLITKSPGMRVLIIDTDYHHADGTFEIARNIPECTVVCVHSCNAESNHDVSSPNGNLIDRIVPNNITPQEYLHLIEEILSKLDEEGKIIDIILYDFGYDIYRYDYGGLENFDILDVANIALRVIEYSRAKAKFGISLNLTGGSDPENAKNIYSKILDGLKL